MPPTPSRKRKADDSPPSKKKLTKEERQLKKAEDAARAKAWAEARAAKKADKKKKATAPTSAASPSSPTPTKPRARRTPGRTTPARRKKAPSPPSSPEETPSPPARPTPKRRKVATPAAKPAAPDEAAGSAKKPSAAKKTKEQRQQKLREDKERADAWAAGRRGGKQPSSPGGGGTGTGTGTGTTAYAGGSPAPPAVPPPVAPPAMPPSQQQQQQQHQAGVPFPPQQPPPPAGWANPLGFLYPNATAEAPPAVPTDSGPSAAARFRAASAMQQQQQQIQQQQMQQQQIQQQQIQQQRRRLEDEARAAAALNEESRRATSPGEKVDFVDAMDHLVGSRTGNGGERGEAEGEAGYAAAGVPGRVTKSVSTAVDAGTRLVKYGCFAAMFVLLLGTVHTAVKPTLKDWEGGDGVGSGKSGRGRARDGMVPPCFDDSPGVPPEPSKEEGEDEEKNEEEDEQGGQWWSAVPPATFHGGLTSCSKQDDTGEYLPCPTHGRCARGFLVDCMVDDTDTDTNTDDQDVLVGLFVPSETFDECVLSPVAKRIVGTVTSTVVELTVAQTCSLSCSSWWGSASYCGGIEPHQVLTTGGADRKEFMFSVEGLTDVIAANAAAASSTAAAVDKTKQRITPRVVEMVGPYLDKDAVRYVEAPSSSFVGLTPDYVSHRLPVPTLCWVRMLLVGLVQAVLGLVQTVLCLLVDAAMKYPLYAALSVIFLYTFSWVRRRRRANAELRSRVAQLRELAIDRLLECDDGEGWSVLHLRDDLGHELHPDSVRDRRYMFDTVWPCVVAEVRRDNRISKATRTVGGKPLDHWEWVAVAAKKGRMSRGGMLSPMLSKKDD